MMMMMMMIGLNG